METVIQDEPDVIRQLLRGWRLYVTLDSIKLADDLVSGRLLA